MDNLIKIYIFKVIYHLFFLIFNHYEDFIETLKYIETKLEKKYQKLA